MFSQIKKGLFRLNWRVIANMLGNVLWVEGLLMLLPFIVTLIYQEGGTKAFAISIAIALLVGVPLSRIKTKRSAYFAKDGMIAVGLSWIAVSMVGALPFYISGEIPSYIDAFFETVSGFTTTGSSILTNVEGLTHGMIFWRSFTHWVGGMGVLVFVLALIPKSNERTMHIMRAEVPGPTIGKLVPRLKQTAMILYQIYMVMTIIEAVLLCLGGMPLFDSLCHSFGTAGTGGFGIKNTSIGYYDNAYYDAIITIFMILFGVNFNIFYFILIKDYKQAFKDAEMRTYFGIIALSIALIAINILPMYDGIFEAIRHASFQVGSIITTTGYSTVDFNLWPTFSKTILFLLMFMGASAGSTGGGIKVSRIMIIAKKVKMDLQKLIHPQKVDAITMNGKIVPEETVNQISSFFGCYMLILAVMVLIVSLDNFDFETTLTSIVACLSNIGPGLGVCGPAGSFATFSNLSKIVLSFAMLIGRLEIYPILILMVPLYWKPKKKNQNKYR